MPYAAIIAAVAGILSSILSGAGGSKEEKQFKLLKNVMGERYKGVEAHLRPETPYYDVASGGQGYYRQGGQKQTMGLSQLDPVLQKAVYGTMQSRYGGGSPMGIDFTSIMEGIKSPEYDPTQNVMKDLVGSDGSKPALGIFRGKGRRSR